MYLLHETIKPTGPFYTPGEIKNSTQGVNGKPVVVSHHIHVNYITVYGRMNVFVLAH